jgi:hypothetical protein
VIPEDFFIGGFWNGVGVGSLLVMYYRDGDVWIIYVKWMEIII